MFDENTKNSIKEKFKELENPVKLIFFKTTGPHCQLCGDITTLLEELMKLSEKLSIENYSLENDSSKVKEYQIEDAPVIVIEGKEKRFVRFFGFPAGHEFTPFIQTIVEVSKGEPGIASDLKKKVKAIDFPVHMKVFVSPTCPYCPGAMKTAHDFALLNPKIKGDVYEVTEFQDIAGKYNVMGVPKTVINDSIELIGAHPPDMVIMKIANLKK